MSREHTPCMVFECLIFTKAAYTQQKSLIWLNCLQVSALLLSHLLICLCIVHQTYIYAHNKRLRIQKASESLTGESTSGIIYLLNPPIWSKTHQSMATSCLTFIICFLFCIAILLLASFSDSLMQILDIASFVSLCFKFIEQSIQYWCNLVQLNISYS